jgi:hypothetical protein
MGPVDRTFTSKLWMYNGKGAWHFLTLPKDFADGIRFFNPGAKGFTPIKVKASIGKTSWKTAIFPDAKSGSFVLVVKADVRKAEKLIADDVVTATVGLTSSF